MTVDTDTLSCTSVAELKDAIVHIDAAGEQVGARKGHLTRAFLGQLQLTTRDPGTVAIVDQDTSEREITRVADRESGNQVLRVRDEARARAPKAQQSLGPNQPPPGTLKRSVIMKHIPEISSLTRQTFFVTVRHGKQYRKQGKKGNLSQDAWYWRFVEFGTVKMSARPFLRPAFDMKKHEAVTAIKTRLAQRIEQAAQELKK